jgi:anti-anti-sigma factor
MSSALSPYTEPVVDLHWLKPDVALLVLGGEHDLESAPGVEQAAGEALATCSHLIVDISPAQFIDSTIINLLVHTKREADTKGSRFNLVLGTTPTIERTLEICGVLPELNRVPDIDAALDGQSPRLVRSGEIVPTTDAQTAG